MRKFLFLVLCCIAPQLMAAEEQTGFLAPEVLKSAVAINLTEEQKPLFQAAISNFVNARMDAINKLMRKNNQTNLGRKIKSKTNSLLRTMDKEMAAFLSEEQMPAYKIYRDTLKDNLRGM
jgi:hypothetical protein